jgi:hypothetical protein
MMEGEAGPSTIPLYLINGVATIWDAQSMSTLITATKSSPLSPLARRHEWVEDEGTSWIAQEEADIQPPLHYIVNMISPDFELGHYQVYPNKMVS